MFFKKENREEPARIIVPKSPVDLVKQNLKMKSRRWNQILTSVLLSMLSHVAMAQGKNPIGVETSGRSEIINGAAGFSSTYPWIVPLADSERD